MDNFPKQLSDPYRVPKDGRERREKGEEKSPTVGDFPHGYIRIVKTS